MLSKFNFLINNKTMARGTLAKRLTEIQKLLGKHQPGLTAKDVFTEIKKHYSCSLKTIRRDLNSLNASGHLIEVKARGTNPNKSNTVTRPGRSTLTANPVEILFQTGLNDGSNLQNKSTFGAAKIYRLASQKVFPDAHRTLGDQELFALVLAEKQMSSLLGSKIYSELQTAFGWLESMMGATGANSLRELREQIQIAGLPKARKLDVPPGTLRLILKACIKHCQISFEYLAAGRKEPAEKKVFPYWLVQYENSLYLTAESAEKNGFIQNYALSRIRDVSIFEKITRTTRKLAPEKQFSELFGIQSESCEPINVSLLFHPDLAPYISEREWPGQSLPPKQAHWPTHTGNAVELHLRLRPSKDLISWILGWGERVKVLAPKSLQEAIRDKLVATQSHYLDL